MFIHFMYMLAVGDSCDPLFAGEELRTQVLVPGFSLLYQGKLKASQG